jgi:Domain of unknown function DUF29
MPQTRNSKLEHRWSRQLSNPDTLADDLGVVGTWVGPRTGPDKRTHGEKEDYVLRRILLAWRAKGLLRFPVWITGMAQSMYEPDFLIKDAGNERLGLEVTEAGEENYQAWLTSIEYMDDVVHLMPLESSTERTAKEILKAIRRKVGKFDQGAYRQDLSACDLAIYDNTAWGGFLDRRQILAMLGHPRELLGRFRHIHILIGSAVVLNCFGNDQVIMDLTNVYETDFAGWARDQAKKLRTSSHGRLDKENIAEELDALARSERRALGAHIRNLLIHLLKHQYQHHRRSKSWQHSIDNARSELDQLLMENPSLKNDLDDLIASEYKRARRDAARQTKLSLEEFPGTSPFSKKQIFNPEFYSE